MPHPQGPQRLYAIVGHPVGQARSPEVFNARFAQAGLDAQMLALDIAPAHFVAALDGLRRIGNLAGLVITVPHKRAAAALAAEPSARVQLLGAANVLRPTSNGWAADLFDGIGFVQGLRSQGPAAVRHAAVVGAGGAGLAIAEALLAQRSRVSLSDVDEASAAAAVQRLRSAYGDAVEQGGPGERHDLAVNATPVGMDGDPRLPFDPAGLRPGTWVAEAIMKPALTPLLTAAAALQLPTLEGRHMLDGQVDAIWDFFHMGAR